MTDNDEDNVHSVWHKFCDYMKKWYFTKSYGWKKDLTGSKRMYKDVDIGKITGWTGIRRVEAYASKNPEIRIAHCDDSMFMGSDIVLVPHKSKSYFMGITMILVPQCGYPQNEVFLYPDHIESLLEALKAIKHDLPISL